jgi:hypothetical protein
MPAFDESFLDYEPELNAFIIGDLVDLDAEEICPLIERAFEASAIDETIVGDWEDIQVELGHRPPLSEEARFEKIRRRFPFTELLARLLDRTCELPEFETARSQSAKRTVDDLGESDAVLEARPERTAQVRMVMPEDRYSADERRRLARQRNKQRKLADRARHRDTQLKKRR